MLKGTRKGDEQEEESTMEKRLIRTKKYLSEYRDMEWKAQTAQRVIQECNDMMTSLQGFHAGAVVQGGENHREELLANCIDRKTGAEAAVSYIRAVNHALEGLDKIERGIIIGYYIDREGINIVMRLCAVSRSRAYERAEEALEHIDRLLF